MKGNPPAPVFDPRANAVAFCDAKAAQKVVLACLVTQYRKPLFLEKSGEKIVALENVPAVPTAHTLQSPNSSRCGGTLDSGLCHACFAENRDGNFPRRQNAAFLNYRHRHYCSRAL